MNTLADCAATRHGDEVSSAFTRQSLYRWGEDKQLIEAAVRAPRGSKWARACMSGGNGLFDEGR
jgi:hypothetical protein